MEGERFKVVEVKGYKYCDVFKHYDLMKIDLVYPAHNFQQVTVGKKYEMNGWISGLLEVKVFHAHKQNLKTIEISLFVTEST